jgi:pimeloyl-ACP methyl ester carboxylesterase
MRRWSLAGKEVARRFATVSPLLAALVLATGCDNVAVSPASSTPHRKPQSDEIACTPSGHDPAKVGVVVIHAGHTFDPLVQGHSKPSPAGRSTAGLAHELERAGFRVLAPEMPWSTIHPYDRTFEEALDQIAAAVEKLQAQGADRVVVVGHSFGGGAVIGFGALRGGVSGIVALAAGVDPAAPVQMEERADSVAKAEAMVAANRADDISTFDDFDMAVHGIVFTTPAHYLSFFSPNGEMSMHRNLAHWPAGLPLLWIDGSDEARNPGRRRMVLSRLRPDPLTRYMLVSASHNMVANEATDAVVAWIRCL